MASERIQWIIVILLALILLVTGVLCYKKDEYAYDPQFQGSEMPPNNPYIQKHFKDVGADVENSINGRRYLASCETCQNTKLTPNACESCASFVKGHNLVKEGV